MSAITIKPRVVTTAELVDYAAEKRRAVIAAGTTVTVGATAIPTWADSDTQAALTALVVAASMNTAIETTWRGRDGQFYPLNASGIVALATGVMTFVQTAFATEAAAVAAITAGTAVTTAAVDQFFA